jgi:hypothetical protein
MTLAAAGSGAAMGKKAQHQALPSTTLPFVNPESARTLLRGLVVSSTVPGMQGDVFEDMGLSASAVMAGHVVVVARGRPRMLGGGRGPSGEKAPNGAPDLSANRACYFPLI